MTLQELLDRVKQHIKVISEVLSTSTDNSRVYVTYRFKYDFPADVVMTLGFVADNEDEQFNSARWRYLKRRYNWS